MPGGPVGEDDLVLVSHLPPGSSGRPAYLGRLLKAHGTMQVSVTVAVCPAVTVADVGSEHGSSLVFPPSTSMSSGERPETWYRPGGSGTEKVPDGPTVTETTWCPAVVNVTVPDMGCSPGCFPPGPSGPPSLTSFPVT